jgi:glycosyltransferase involved in cell wall biosynthesis
MHSGHLATEYARAASVNPNRIVVLPLPSVPVPAEKPEPARSRATLGLPSTPRIILFFGQIRAYKGIDTLTAAMDIILAARSDVHVVVAGTVADATLKSELTTFAANHPQAVTLLTSPSPLSAAAITDALNASDLVVLPFRSASQSGSVVHALSYERAVLTTRVGDLVRLADLGVVRAVAPDDPCALAQSCAELLDDDDLRSDLAAAGSSFARTELDPRRIGEHLLTSLEAA